MNARRTQTVPGVLTAIAGQDIRRLLLPLMTIVGLVGLWWGAAIQFGWDKFIVPTPGDVWSELVQHRALLPAHFMTTLGETLGGFALAIAIGVPAAILIAYSALLSAMINPVLVAFNSIPKIAIAPIFVIWMGFGASPKIAMVVLLCFFPIVLSTATGLKSTAAEFLDLVRSLSRSPVQIFLRVRLPAALPHIFVGLKLAITLAVIGAVVGEFVGATHGLGYVIVASGQNANTALAFAAMAILGLMSMALFYAIAAVERLVIPWANHLQP
jgi:NitT/TauT family transport system permease protein